MIVIIGETEAFRGLCGRKHTALFETSCEALLSRQNL